METQVKTITVENTVKAPIQKIWQCWTKPETYHQMEQLHPPIGIPQLRKMT